MPRQCVKIEAKGTSALPSGARRPGVEWNALIISRRVLQINDFRSPIAGMIVQQPAVSVRMNVVDGLRK